MNDVQTKWAFEYKWHILGGVVLMVLGVVLTLLTGPKPQDLCYAVARSVDDQEVSKDVPTIQETTEKLMGEGFYPEYNQRYLSWSSRVGGGKVTHGYSIDSLSTWWNLPSCIPNN
jgi:hypothetical protein